jgi:hypothetical protein
MEEQAGTSQRAEASAKAVSRRRSRIVRSAVLLLAGLVALCFVILVTRDVRHKASALALARSHAETITKRVGSQGLLPRNLNPETEEPVSQWELRFHCPPSQDVPALREYHNPIIVAQSTVIRQVFRTNGRAVVLFDKGRCEARWMGTGAFDRQYEEQQAFVEQKRRSPGLAP